MAGGVVPFREVSRVKVAVALFTRVPVPGRTKTRLSPPLSGEECAEFHRACLADVSEAVRASGLPAYLFQTGGDPEEELEHIWGRLGLTAADRAHFRQRSQEGEGLGERMLRATEAVLVEWQGCLLVGADVPEVGAETLREAARKLETADVVLGPALDGGYYLLGLKRAEPALFAGLPWGTGRVLAGTVAAAEAAGLAVAYVEERADIDAWADLVALYEARRDGEQGIGGRRAFACAARLVGKHGRQQGEV